MSNQSIGCKRCNAMRMGCKREREENKQLTEKAKQHLDGIVWSRTQLQGYRCRSSDRLSIIVDAVQRMTSFSMLFDPCQWKTREVERQSMWMNGICTCSSISCRRTNEILFHSVWYNDQEWNWQRRCPRDQTVFWLTTNAAFRSLITTLQMALCSNWHCFTASSVKVSSSVGVASPSKNKHETWARFGM